MEKPLIYGRDLKPNNVCDINGKKIEPAMRLRFYPQYRDDGTWEANTEIEDGVLTVSILNTMNVRNPDGWSQKHDWIKSRHWAIRVGYGEYGSWNCPRNPISGFAVIRQKSVWKRLAHKYGPGNRYVNAKILGPAIELETL